jgi:hypothetical protein
MDSKVKTHQIKYNSRRNQKGFLLIVASLTLSLLSLFFILFLGHFQALEFSRLTRNQCRQEFLSLYDRTLDQIYKAIDLNHALKGLNIGVAKTGLIAMATPYDPSLWSVHFKMIKARENIVNTQNTLLKVTELQWKRALLAHPFQKRKSQKSVYKIEMTNLRVRKPQWSLPVRRQDPQNPYSLLEFIPNIETHMKLEKIWNQVSQLQYGDKQWTKTHSITLGCQVTMKRLNPEKAMVVLTEDKPWLKARFFF